MEQNNYIINIQILLKQVYQKWPRELALVLDYFGVLPKMKKNFSVIPQHFWSCAILLKSLIYHFLDLSLPNAINSPKDNFGSCPKNAYVFAKFNTDYCCCENKCCWDKCVNKSPPKKCLEGVPNAAWEYNPTLRYFQAVKGGKIYYLSI